MNLVNNIIWKTDFYLVSIQARMWIVCQKILHTNLAYFDPIPSHKVGTYLSRYHIYSKIGLLWNHPLFFFLLPTLILITPFHRLLYQTTTKLTLEKIFYKSLDIEILKPKFLFCFQILFMVFKYVFKKKEFCILGKNIFKKYINSYFDFFFIYVPLMKWK